RIDLSESYVKDIVNHNEVVYGINTGFGPLCDTLITPQDTANLQHNLLKSHAVGVGKPIPPPIAKTMMIIKAQALAKGYSGVQLRTLERIIWMAEQDIIPVVPEQGSVGASGDLAPLSRLFLPLIGLGHVYYKGEVVPAKDVLQARGMPPLQLAAKEGLVHINGTQLMAAYAVHGLLRLYSAVAAADRLRSMSLEGIMGTYGHLDARRRQIRP